MSIDSYEMYICAIQNQNIEKLIQLKGPQRLKKFERLGKSKKLEKLKKLQMV